MFKITAMLLIEIPSEGPSALDLQKFEAYDIPRPPGGLDQEVNDRLVLRFEDEQQAVEYAQQIEQYANRLESRDSAAHRAASAILEAIGKDDFVRSYTQR